MTALAIACVLLGSTGSAPIVEVPFEGYKNHIYVHSSLNGVRVPALLSSGSSATVIDLAVREQLGIQVVGRTAAGGAGPRNSSAQVLQGAWLEIEGLRVPVVAALNLGEASQLEGRPILAMLGADLLHRYAVQIDYPKQMIRFYPKGGYAAVEGDRGTSFRLDRGRPHVEVLVRIDKREEKAIAMLDTGYDGSFSLSARGARLADIDRERLRARGIGVNGWVAGRDAYVDSVRIAPEVTIGPLWGIAATSRGIDDGTGSSFDLLLGGAVLNRYVLTFDAGTMTVYFREPAKAPVEPTTEPLPELEIQP